MQTVIEVAELSLNFVESVDFCHILGNGQMMDFDEENELLITVER